MDFYRVEIVPTSLLLRGLSWGGGCHPTFLDGPASDGGPRAEVLWATEHTQPLS